MEEIIIGSDGKRVLVKKDNGNIVINLQKHTYKINIDKIRKVYIARRKTHYKPDLFFAVYTLLSILISISIVYFFMKNEKNLNLPLIAISVTTAIVIGAILITVSANRKQALFIAQDDKTVEIPIDNAEKVKDIELFFKNINVNVYHSD